MDLTEDETLEKPKLSMFKRIAGEKPAPADKHSPQAAKPPLSLVEPVAQPPATAAGQEQPAEDGQDQEPQPVHTAACGFFRGRHGAPFLEFQFLDKEWIAASYSDLKLTRWAPAGRPGHRGAAFVLEYRDGRQAIVWGRTLRMVLEGIQRHAVFRVTEMGEEASRFLPDDAPVIYAIEIVEPEEQKEAEGKSDN